MFFSIVTLVKLGLILTSIPLSLIHAIEEILHENPSDKLLKSLAIIFGILGPFIIAFPIIVCVQLVYATSQFQVISPAMVPLALTFVFAPSLLYVIAIVIHQKYTHKWRMIWYYIFPICVHFALEFAFMGVLFGFDTVIKSILTIEFVLIFGADCCLVIIILSDALFGVLVKI